MFYKFTSVIVLLTTFAVPAFLSGCGTVGGELKAETQEECDRLGVSRSCNSKLYADQITALGNELIRLYDAGKVRQTSYNFYAGLMQTATERVNLYYTGEGGLSDVADTLDTVGSFISAKGGTFDKIIVIFD